MGFFAVHPPIHRDTWEQVQTIMGRISSAAFITRYLEHYPACQYLNQHQSAGERVLLFGENRGFYLDRDYVWGDPVLQQIVDYRSLTTPEALLRRLQDLHIRWVLYRTGLFGPDYLTPQAARLMQATLAQYGQENFRQGPVTVFRLEDP
jgi:hypothetical protein